MIGVHGKPTLPVDRNKQRSAISAMQVPVPSIRPAAGGARLVYRCDRRSDRLRLLRTLRPLPRLVTMW